MARIGQAGVRVGGAARSASVKLRGDPAAFFRTRGDVEAAARKALARAQAAEPRFLGRLPRTPCVVKRIEPFEEKDSADRLLSARRHRRHAPRRVLRQHLQARDAAALRGRGARLPRVGPRPPHPDRARAGADRAARVPQARGRHRVRRGVGALRRGARRRAGPVQGRARTSRAAQLRRLARQPPGRGHRHPRHGLEPRARDRVLRGERDPRQGQHRQRGRPLHRVAGPGARVQAGRARDPAAADGRRDAPGCRRSTSRRSTTWCWAAGR